MEQPKSGDKKGSKFAHISKNHPKDAASLHGGIISQQRFDTVTHLGQTKTFYPFGPPWGGGGQIGVKKDQKLPFPLIITHKVANM